MLELIKEEINYLEEKLNYLECFLPEMERAERREAIYVAQVYKETIEKLKNRL
jgi:hypothetical protein